jgi:hypothetical protein
MLAMRLLQGKPFQAVTDNPETARRCQEIAAYLGATGSEDPSPSWLGEEDPSPSWLGEESRYWRFDPPTAS